MKKLLVPCDFSHQALNAFQFALDIAAKSPNSTVHLLHVVELPVLHDSVLMPVLSFEQDLMDELKEKADKEFDIVEKTYNKDKVKVVSEVLFGKVSDMIVRYCQDQQIDMLIMGSHGASGVRELFIGSNAEKIVRHSAVPVLVVKDTFKGPIKNIVFPNTLETEHQEDLVMKVKELQHFFGAHLHILWVNTPLNFTTDTETKKRLEQFVKRFQFKNYTINTYNHLSAEEGIIDFAKNMDASLIAMGTHGRKGIAHMFYGSLTESLVNHTEKLVWSYVMKPEPVTA
ncbi:MAG: universal stress protein [Cyclobacteriaceae bacterium]|nr:universal stress protein [Cyclobacteriaceae bacterium]